MVRYHRFSEQTAPFFCVCPVLIIKAEAHLRKNKAVLQQVNVQNVQHKIQAAHRATLYEANRGAVCNTNHKTKISLVKNRYF
jgi:hypothetical protein